MLKILNIVGARPNFMKIAPIHRAMLGRAAFQPLIVHTGQHYDQAMSDSFFADLGIPKPDFHLEVGSASHAVQTARIMTEFEPVVLQEKPDWVLVVGDVNSTIACALVCAKLGIKVAHVEAGLRSRDRTMPEEINRILTDAISDLLLTTSEDADANLKQEGVAEAKIKFVGNVMIDSLFYSLKLAEKSSVREDLHLTGKDYAVLTLHRPSNVDDAEAFAAMLDALVSVSQEIPVIFPAHPRTKANIERFGLADQIKNSNIRLIDPLGYLDFLRLYSGAKMVLTDSGGLQEETTALSIPCLTLRENTERPITISHGTNILVGTNPRKIKQVAREILESGNPRVSKGGTGNDKTKPADIIERSTLADARVSETKRIPPLWDGKAAERICDVLIDF